MLGLASRMMFLAQRVFALGPFRIPSLHRETVAAGAMPKSITAIVAIPNATAIMVPSSAISPRRGTVAGARATKEPRNGR